MSNLYGGLTTPHWNQIDKIHIGPFTKRSEEDEEKDKLIGLAPDDEVLLGRYVLVKYLGNIVFSQDERNAIINREYEPKNEDGSPNTELKEHAKNWLNCYKIDSCIDYDGVVFIKQLSDNNLVYTPVARLSTTVTDQSFKDINSKLSALIDKDTPKEGETQKSIRTIANEELVEQLLSKDAEASFKTLQELATWIEDHPESAAEMNEKISQNAIDISAEAATRAQADTTLEGKILQEISDREQEDNELYSLYLKEMVARKHSLTWQKITSTK